MVQNILRAENNETLTFISALLQRHWARCFENFL